MATHLVIGASSGIGKTTALSLLEKGHHVIGTYNTTEPNIEHTNFEAFAIDVLSNPELDFLPEEINGLVYCPGSINLMPFHRIKPEQFIEDYNLQVVGAVNIIQKSLNKLKKGKASVVLLSTVAVQNGFNFHSLVASSKGAIEGLTRSLAAEFAPTVRINAVAPSLTDTPLAAKLLSSDEKRKANDERHPLKRIGTTDDIASAIQYLLSPESSWVSGQILHIDGGMSSIRG